MDSGVRTGLQASPYDLDFTVVDYDSDVRIQLFYASVSGITSVSAAGVYPNQKFALGTVAQGVRSITDSTTLTDRDRSFSWDITDPVVDEGAYFLYVVATDSENVTVGNSISTLTVKHSPSFTFFEPAKDTQRNIDSGAQSVYSIQWQKGPGDKDLDDDASIRLYFTTDDPAVTDHSTESGASSTSLTSDGDTRDIKTTPALSENGDGASDMFVWNLKEPPEDIPVSGQQVWVYAVITDGPNTTVARGGSLIIDHSPRIMLKTRMPVINSGDMVRMEWDDYMVDDMSGTDDANIRLYASRRSGLSTIKILEDNVFGGDGLDDTFIINSSDGTASGTITAIAESDANSFVWDTETSSFSLPEGEYFVYATMSADATFSDNTTGPVSQAPNVLEVKGNTGAVPHMVVSPNKVMASVGDTLTFDILVQTGGEAIVVVTAVLNVGSDFEIQTPGSPFTDPDIVFPGGTVLANTSSGQQEEFSKTGGAQIVGTGLDPVRLATFEVVVKGGFNGNSGVNFDADDASLSIVGRSVPLSPRTGLSALNGQVKAVPRGRLLATVYLEGRAPPIGFGDHATLLDVHLRLPGSTTDIDDAIFKAANDDFAGHAGLRGGPDDERRRSDVAEHTHRSFRPFSQGHESPQWTHGHAGDPRRRDTLPDFCRRVLCLRYPR